MNTNENSDDDAGILSDLAKIHRLAGERSDLVRLEYLFYTDLDLKGEALAEDLEKLKYEVEVDATHRKCDCTRVYGKSALLKNDEDTIKNWYLEMREVGGHHECDFICYSVIEDAQPGVDEILNSRQVVNVEKFESGKAAQEGAAPVIMDILRKLGDETNRELVLDFFFYTNEQSKADELMVQLKKYGYTVNVEDSARQDLRFSIVGHTIPLPNEDGVIEDWAKKMNELGFIHDCEFDGWGTTGSTGGWFSDETPDEEIRKRLGLPPSEE